MRDRDTRQRQSVAIGAGCFDDDSLSRVSVSALLDRLRRAHSRLRQRPVDDILISLEGVVAQWLQPGSTWRETAEEMLPAATGFSPAMIRLGLPWMLESLRAPAIADLLAAELGDRDALDMFVGGRRVIGPPIVLHMLPGNLPATAAIPMVLSLAIKSCPLMKSAHGDRVFAQLFARSIAAVDPELGECIGACYWEGGDRSAEEPAFAGADLVVASGDDETIAALRSRCPVRFIGHGHKVSCAVITADVLADAAGARSAAAALATDVSLWDQQGCLSPQVCFVEGDFEAACAWAELLVPELARLAERLPPRASGLAERAAIRHFRDEAEWARAAKGTAALYAPGDSTDWTVVVEREGVFRPTPLARSLRVLPVRRFDDLERLLGPARSIVEAAGRVSDSARAAHLDEVLARAGVHWIAPLGQMQHPPLSWPQGGRPRVGDWVEWTTA